MAPEPLQVIPVGRNAHSIRTDESNKFVFVCTLGSDEIFQFTFDPKTGHLASNTPAVFLTKPALGPRHFITSSDNKFVYVLSELTGTITTLSADKDGKVSRKLVGIRLNTPIRARARGAAGPSRHARPAACPPRNTDNDTRAADLHLTPNGKFLYMTERTSISPSAPSRCRRRQRQAHFSGTDTFTENQPWRGFAIDPKGRFLCYFFSGQKSNTISAWT